MRTAAWFLTVFLLGQAAASAATMHIAGDLGGRIGDYLRKYDRLRATRDGVMIDGVCASACTLVLAELPPERICITQKAALLFHAAWQYDRDGKPRIDPDATRDLYALYPAPIREFIASRGGLTEQPILLGGRTLRSMYAACFDPRGPMY